MRTVAAPSDKRFRRAHVSPARKRWKPSRATLIRVAVAVVVGVFCVYQSVAFVFTTGALKVARITVEGNQRMSRGEVLSLLDGLEGAHMLTVDLETWRQKLRGAPWVADATLRRVFPRTIMVVIAEREPMGIGRLDDRLMLVDPEGTIIDEFGPNYADARPADHRRPGRRRPARSWTASAPFWPAGCSPDCSSSPSWRAWCRRSTSATCATPPCCSRTTPPC